MKKLGLYGGTFSPPHLGHLHTLQSFLNSEMPEKTMIMPTYLPPHKTMKDKTSPEDRLAMARLAFAGIPGVEVSDLEILRGGKSFTSTTLETLDEEDQRIILLCGTDMFLTLEEWHCPEVIFRLADIVCMARKNDREEENKIREKARYYQGNYGATTRMLPFEPMTVSSTEIRDLIRNGQMDEAKELLPSKVFSYIGEKGLYRI